MRQSQYLPPRYLTFTIELVCADNLTHLVVQIVAGPSAQAELMMHKMKNYDRNNATSWSAQSAQTYTRDVIT